MPDATPSARHDAVVGILGLRRSLGHGPATLFAVHDALLEGLPAAALGRAVQHFAALRDQRVFESVLAISTRTFQRLKETPTRKLDAEVSGRLWRFTEIVTRAADVLGSEEAAERWMATPAMALDQRRPIDLMATTTGSGLVETLLDRMDHGVYT